MIVYCWQFVEWSDPNGADMSDSLHLAVVGASELANLFALSSINETRTIQVAKLPTDSPRHLDNPNERIDDKSRSFHKLRLIKSDRKSSFVMINEAEDSVELLINNSLVEEFVSSLQESSSMGYFCDNELKIDFFSPEGSSYSSAIYFWATEDESVIYY